jgi:hypothetical protein
LPCSTPSSQWRSRSMCLNALGGEKVIFQEELWEITIVGSYR